MTFKILYALFFLKSTWWMIGALLLPLFFFTPFWMVTCLIMEYIQRGAADYIAVAKSYHTVFISGIPTMSMRIRDKVTLFPFSIPE